MKSEAIIQLCDDLPEMTMQHMPYFGPWEARSPKLSVEESDALINVVKSRHCC